jgi:probable F420-dependent oxidoreductase
VGLSASVLPRRSVVLPYWPDRPPEEALDVARAAGELGYGELWVGEMATYDAMALATAVGLGPSCPPVLTLGPLAVHVRTPVGIAVGAASVAALTGHRVRVALGTSSDVVAEGWHGRPRTRPAAVLEESAVAVRAALGGERGPGGFRLRLPAGDPPHVTVAAFGARALEVAARRADRLVLNLVPPAAAGRLRAQVPGVTACVWVPVAVDPEPEALRQVARGLVAYVGAPGYAEELEAAGFGDVVERARAGAHPKDLLAAIPDELVGRLAAVGSPTDVAARLAAYHAAGIDEVGVVPATAGDTGGRRTLAALAALGGPAP